jgi:spore germination protein GerM
MKSTRNTILKTILVLSFVLISIIFFVEFFINENKISVYFVKSLNATESKLYEVKRPLAEKAKRLDLAILELLKGPTPSELKDGYYTEIPKGTKLIGIEYLSKETDINLSKEFNSEGGSESLELGLKQLVKTIFKTNPKTPVYLEVEGKKLRYLGGEGLEVPQPLKKI